MKSWTITGIIVLATIALSVPVSASVTGYVEDTGGQPVEGALVTFTDEANPDKYYLDYTDEAGLYEVAPTTVSVAHDQPMPFTLQQNFPNPFNPTTTIPYSLSSSGHVRVDVFNITGQRIATLVNTHMAEGSHTTSWNGRDESGKAVGAGIYLYRLSSGEMSEARKMLLIDGGRVGAGIASRSYLPHASAKRTDSMTFRVTITGDVIREYEENNLAVVDGGAYDFTVQRVSVVHGIILVGISGGTFQMGDVEGFGNDNERPVHAVTVSDFEMGIYEVTNAQYARYLTDALVSGDITATSTSVTGASSDWSSQEYLDIDSQHCQIGFGGGTFTVDAGMENRPVVYVTWYGSKAFAAYYGLDLPTEAEWEYACRGGQQLMYGTDDGTIDSTKANYNRNVGHATDVGSYPPNPFGLYDMSGNIYEWCHDWDGDFSGDSATNPTGAASGSYRIGRGGNWGNNADYCRASYRGSSDPAYSYSGIGFRVVRRPGRVTY
jgi:formylglycine-generating enzyme required for sulfatase activity